MNTTRINIKAIKAIANTLKQGFPRKTGIIMRISVSVESPAHGRQHAGFAVWKGTRESLHRALDELLDDWSLTEASPFVRLHATHPAVRELDCPASHDITCHVFGQQAAAR